MNIIVEFDDGPERGTVRTFPEWATALPSLIWCGEHWPRIEATYCRLGNQPDPLTGHWHYRLAASD